MILCWRALRWRGTGFDETSDPVALGICPAAEWFPMSD